MPLDESTQKALVRRIKALLAKTVEQGASEQEALSAMTKAHELLAKYQLDLSDLDIREEGTHHVEIKLDRIKFDLAVRVAQYCDCKVWQESKQKKLHFLGISTDAQFAEWLLLALADYTAKRQVNFMFSGDTTPHEDESFLQGCIKRINERLNEEVQKRKLSKIFTETSGSGRDLVPLKNAMINEAFRKMGISLGNARRGKQRIWADPNAFAQGRKAGENVGFNRPVSNERNETKLLKGF